MTLSERDQRPPRVLNLPHVQVHKHLEVWNLEKYIRMSFFKSAERENNK